MGVGGRIIAVAVLVAAVARAAWGGPGDLFEVDRRPVRRAVVTAGEAYDDGARAGSPMLDRLDGVLADLGAREIAVLRRAAEASGGVPEGSRRLGVVHLLGSVSTRRVELVCDPAGGLHARDLDDAELSPVDLDPARLGELMIGWGAPVPTALPADGAAAEPWPGRVILTDAVVTQRYTGRGKSRASAGLPAMRREVSDDRVLVRLPEGHDPAAPSGVVVWVSPVDDPWMPEVFGPALDELGLILVGAAGNGNQRPILDRLQVAIDALETVRRAHLVDDERVYATGMSGGGRCASILLGAFPEVFCGAVPIVGMNSWHVVRLDDDRMIPRQMATPRRDVERVLKTRRLRGITGSEDINAFEMRERTRMCAEDGLDYRLDDYEGMGHEMPTPERFAAALRWVDEPRRVAIAEGEAAARGLLGAHVERFGEGPPAGDEARASLVEVTRAGPWSGPARTAARWLGYDLPGG